MTHTDPYTLEGTFINRLGIASPQLLHHYEYHMATARAVELFVRPVAATFDLAHVQAIHRHLFGDVYDWAGQFRLVPLDPGTSQERPMTSGRHLTLESWGESLLKPLQEGRGQPALLKEAFVEHITQHFSQLHAWSPFRTGNKRAFKILIEQYANALGYQFDWNRTRRVREFHEAAEAAQFGDGSSLRGVFRIISTPQRAAAFHYALERNNPNIGLHRHPELADAFRTLELAQKEFKRQRLSEQTFSQRMLRVTAILQRELEEGRVPAAPTAERLQQLLWSSRNRHR